MDNQNVLPPDTANLPKNGRARAINLSSSTTLFWRLFMPLFGTVLFGTFTGALLLTDVEDMGLPFPAMWVRVAAILLILAWFYFVWRVLWRLKRVDADATHLYVTNYWTSVRYPWSDIERVEKQKRLGRRVVHFHLRAPGRFGQRISFLPGSSYANWAKEFTERTQ